MCRITDSLIDWLRRMIGSQSADRPTEDPPAADRPALPRGKDTAMSLWSRIFRPVAARQVSNWAVEVARRCQIEVAGRLNDSIHRMSLPEARGYIRARSAGVIDAEIALQCRRTGCRPAVAAAIRQRAVEESVRLAIGDLLRAARRTVVAPQSPSHRPLRKAA